MQTKACILRRNFNANNLSDVGTRVPKILNNILPFYKLTFKL